MPVARHIATSVAAARHPVRLGAPGQRTHLSQPEALFFVVATLLYWTDLLRLVFPGTDGVSSAFRAIHFAFYGAFAVALMRDHAGLLHALRATPLLVTFLLLPLVSTVWSVSPTDTTQRAIALIGSSLFGYYAATQIAGRTVLRLLASAAGIAAAISLVLIVLVPSMGRMSEGEYVNVWSGAWVHKNGMGQMCGLGVLISLIVIMRDGLANSRLIAIGLALNTLLLAGSQSLTAQLVIILSIVLLFTVGRFVRFVFANGLLLAILIAPVLVYVVFTISIDDLFELLPSLGKDATLSSRLPLWQALVDFIAQRVWLGYGYEAFFSETYYAMQVLEHRLNFKPSHAHNGWIETWLGLGALGVGLFACLLVRFIWLAGRLIYRDDTDPLFLLCLLYIPILLLQNTAEVTILQRNSMSWSLFVMMYAFLALANSQRARGETSHNQNNASRLSIV